MKKMRPLACNLIPEHIVPGRAYDVKMLVGILEKCVLVGEWVGGYVSVSVPVSV